MHTKPVMAHAMLAPAFLASLVAIAALAACSGLPRGQDGVTAIQFRDVVVPAGLRLLDDAHQSHSVEAASFRQGRFVYMGTVHPADAAGYVRQRMPQHNWQLVSEENPDPNTTTLRYVRGYYAATYAFTRTDGRTQLVVDYDTDYSRR